MKEEILQRCGYCGNFFAGNNYVSFTDFTEEELNNAPLGYCPNAQAEHYALYPEEIPEQ